MKNILDIYSNIYICIHLSIHVYYIYFHILYFVPWRQSQTVAVAIGKVVAMDVCCANTKEVLFGANSF